METTAARRPPANDEGVCGMFINLFRRQITPEILRKLVEGLR